MRIPFYLILILIFPGNILSQEVYRIQGDFSLKSKENGISQLVMGKFYYDLNSSQIIYRNFFPEKETWITSDTTLYHVVNEDIISTQSIPDFSKFSVFHLSLTRNLKNYGIDGKGFTLDNVEQDNGMVISTYAPNRKYNRYSGKIILSMMDGMLFGIVFYDTEDNIIKKQFCEDYITDLGLPFPGKITEIIYQNGTEYYKITTYKNVIYNANEPDDLYYFNPGI